MQNTWLVVLPPLIALFLSFATHRIILSLFLGILSATLIFHDFSIIPALKTFGTRLWEILEIEKLLSWEAFKQNESLYIYFFLIILGVLITLISTTGAAKAYGNFINKKLKSKKAAETSSLFLSLCFFIDDYLNVLMVGSVMPPITDRYKVPRVKLAFFANAFAAALCIIVPFSTWAAYILRQIEHSGISTDASPDVLISATPFSLFTQSIPYAFYSFIMIAATFFLVRRGISFGLVKKHEDIAEETGNLFGKRTATQRATPTSNTTSSKNDSTIIDFLFPIVILVSGVFVGLFLTGFVAAPSLFIGGVSSIAITIPYFFMRKKLKLNQLMPIIKEGFELMRSSLIVITLAWTFASILTADLETGQFMAAKLQGSIPIFLFPLIFFIVTTITTLAIGSAWGSLGIMTPIAISMIAAFYTTGAAIPLSAAPMIIPTFSAILAGAVAGNIISPIADIVVLSSTSTKSHHMEHVKSQQMYVFPVFIASCVSFLISGILTASTTFPSYLNVMISLGSGILVSFAMLSILNQRR